MKPDMSNVEQIRTFRFEMFNGETMEVRSASFPWMYREWLVVADVDGVKRYHPRENVLHWSEVA